MRYFLFSICLAITFSSCIEVLHPFTEIPPGMWRAELKITKDEVLPFNFESVYSADNQLSIFIHNDTERIELTDIDFGRNAKLEDTIYIDFPLLDSHIEGIYKEGVIEGQWIRHNREDYHIPFVANHGAGHRFTTGTSETVSDITGTWQTTFEVETKDEYPAVGEFVQSGNRVTGTFMTETGDYRYLEGELQVDDLKLSCFDGGHAFLFTGKVNESGNIIGKFFSGNHYETNWVAIKKDDAEISSPYDLTAMVNPSEPLTFSLPNSEGKIISIDDDQYQGKAKLITITGTWCPNCLEEARFIIDYLSKNPDLDIEVIALAFEKYRNADKVQETLRRYKTRLKMPYEILHAGYYDKKEATQTFKFLDEIISYPTILYVDKNNIVTKVHTGYAGTATSKYHEFADDFDETVKKLVL